MRASLWLVLIFLESTHLKREFHAAMIFQITPKSTVSMAPIIKIMMHCFEAKTHHQFLMLKKSESCIIICFEIINNIVSFTHTHRSSDSRRTRNYDIDNIVIPYSVAAATRIELLNYKEIPTPK